MSIMVDPNRADAIAWAVRVADPDFSDWEGLARWLDGDAERSDAYLRATVMIDDAVAMLSSGTVAEPAEILETDAEILPFERPVRRWRLWAMAGATALAAGISGILLLAPEREVRSIRVIDSVAGKTRHVVLGDGSHVELAGGTRLSFDPLHPRQVTLARGRAVFTVRHDDAEPFSVDAGGYRIVDVGTAFEVVQTAGKTDVAVAEGEVMVRSDARPVMVKAGRGVLLQAGSAPRLFDVAPSSIGQWRKAQMTYRSASLALIASDLSAALGHPVAVGAGLEARRFTGSLLVSTVRNRPEELGDALDVKVTEIGDGWTLSAR
ncbi:MAG: FecR domain-containing protein [Sphingomonas phyllosphaerae]